jgi:hypothetical protein
VAHADAMTAQRLRIGPGRPHKTASNRRDSITRGAPIQKGQSGSSAVRSRAIQGRSRAGGLGASTRPPALGVSTRPSAVGSATKPSAAWATWWALAHILDCPSPPNAILRVLGRVALADAPG